MTQKHVCKGVPLLKISYCKTSFFFAIFEHFFTPFFHIFQTWKNFLKKFSKLQKIPVFTLRNF